MKTAGELMRAVTDNALTMDQAREIWRQQWLGQMSGQLELDQAIATPKRWEAKSLPGVSKEVDELMAEGWEPFAVTANPQTGRTTYHLRREVR